MELDKKTWDLFICHANEDKAEIARPLAEKLSSIDLKVWYDEFSLTMGDSIRRSIEKGLNGSRYGLVILSPTFFEKEWPQKELDALAEKEINGTKVILPIWHKVERKEVAKYSLILADRIAAKTDSGLDSVVNDITKAIMKNISKNEVEKNDPEQSLSYKYDPNNLKTNDSSSKNKTKISKKSKKYKVVYLGPQFTFSHEAAIRIFPHYQHFFERSPKKLFERVDTGEMDFGILPIENSATGIVYEFLPLLVDQDFLPLSNDVNVHIAKELFMPIFLHLLSRSTIDPIDILNIYSNKQPYLQCFDWIERNLPNAKIEIVESTAAAADMLHQDPKGVCIGGDLLAKEKKLIKVREKINDFSRNVTRFIAISSKSIRSSNKKNKSTFAITIPDEIGSLMRYPSCEVHLS